MNCTRKFRYDGVMYMIKVLLADDQELIRESLGFVLGAQGDITVVGMAKNGREAIELVRSEKPDVVLMDIRMPEVDGVECTRLIKSAHPNIKVIVLTTFDDDEYVFNALRFGTPPDFILLIVFSSVFISTGFEIWAFIPAAREC